jgi:circadian clock protein KaiB
MKRKSPGDEAKAFEKALEKQDARRKYKLRLYVTGTTGRSMRAIQNIRAICEEKLKNRYELEVIDIYQHPELLKNQQVVVAPTLLKRLPLPVRRIIGDLSDQERVLAGLDILPAEEPPKE